MTSDLSHGKTFKSCKMQLSCDVLSAISWYNKTLVKNLMLLISLRQLFARRALAVNTPVFGVRETDLRLKYSVVVCQLFTKADITRCSNCANRVSEKADGAYHFVVISSASLSPSSKSFWG